MATNLRRAEVTHIPSDLVDYAVSVSRGLNALEDGEEHDGLIKLAHLRLSQYLGKDPYDISSEKEMYYNQMRHVFYTAVQKAMLDKHKWYILNHTAPSSPD